MFTCIVFTRTVMNTVLESIKEETFLACMWKIFQIAVEWWFSHFGDLWYKNWRQINLYGIPTYVKSIFISLNIYINITKIESFHYFVNSPNVFYIKQFVENCFINNV